MVQQRPKRESGAEKKARLALQAAADEALSKLEALLALGPGAGVDPDWVCEGLSCVGRAAEAENAAAIRALVEQGDL